MVKFRQRAREAAKAPKGPLPHDTDREESQPYAKEHEDYTTGVVRPPKDQHGRAGAREPSDDPPK